MEISTEKPEYLYEHTAQYIRELIEEGTIQKGDRIPSVRRLHQHLGVSISTVLGAYQLLENQGWIQAKPQSGYYAKANPDEVLEIPSRTLPQSTEPQDISLAYQVSQTLQQHEMLQLGAAVPDSSLLPIKTLNRIMGKILRDSPQEAHQYLVPPGHLGLRKAIARRVIDAGCRVTPEEVVITNGASEALFLSLKLLTEAGDTVVIESPVYYSLLEILNRLQLKVIEIPCSAEQGIHLQELEQTFQQHRVKVGVIISNFSNPLGSLMSDVKKETLVQLFDQYQIPLIEDDVYGELGFISTDSKGGDSQRPKALKAFDPKVIYCSSISKSLSPGLRVGWCLPGQYLQEFQHLKLALNLGSSYLPQATVAQFLSGGGYDKHLRQLRQAFQSQLERMTLAIRTYFPAGTKVSRPQGGFFLWVELPEYYDAMQLHLNALEHQISIAPGPIFSASGYYRHSLRLNCGLAWSHMVEEGIIKIGQLLQQQRE